VAAFDEVLFPVDISKGAVGGPSFSTIVIVTGSGAEQRTAQWRGGRRKWNVGQSLKSSDQASDLIAFWVARQGKARGFRFRDWTDFYVDDGDPHATSSIDTTHFQLQKVYTSGLVTQARKITKPVSGTVRVWNPGTGLEVTSGWTVDTTTGILTFSLAPGYIPEASFEFDVPARFDTDEMSMSYDDVDVRSWDSIPIVELLV
jgi:uncharacterized protein (TIGR02217 family)